MTRRDRAALVLAYEWCRARFRWTRTSQRHAESDADFAVGLAVEAMDLGANVGEDIVAATLKRNGERVLGSQRLLRARLALYIRAVLRADKGDWGPLWCACGDKIDADEDPGNARLMRQCFGCQAAYRYTRGRRNQGAWSYVPLWEQARAKEGGT